MKKIIIILSILISTITFSQEKKFITYKVIDNETITSIAKKIGITPYDLLKLNPDAKNGINIDEVLIIPNKNFKKTNSVKSIVIKNTKILSYRDSIKNGILYHRVKFGETIYSLSKKYKVKKKKVLKLNKLKKRSKIAIGQLLKFPTKKADTKVVKVIAPTPKEVTTLIIKPQSDFITYTVKADDTKYSLSRNHHISVDELEHINPQLKNKTLNEYDIILLPRSTKLTPIIKNTNQTTSSKKHIVKAQETFYKLTKLYNISKEKLIELNPLLINGLKKDMVLIITENKIIETPSTYTSHKVQSQETLYGISKMYQVTKMQLLILNPDLKDGLKQGMTIKIPKPVEEKLLGFENDYSGKSLDVLLMLPFKADQKINLPLSIKNKSTKEIKKINNLNRITDFYLGAKMALDDLKSKGLSINLKVLDTKGSITTTSNIISTNDLSNTDVIIGPLFYKNVEQISRMISRTNIPVISPVSTKDHSTLMSKNIVQSNVSKKLLQQKLLNYIKNNYADHNIILIADQEKDVKFKVQSIVANLKQHDSISKINVLYMQDGYIEKERFTKVVNEKTKNCILLFSNKVETTDSAVNLAKDHQFTLFSFNKGKNFKEIKNSDLNMSNFHFASSRNYETNNIDLINFDNNYKAIYNTLPSEFVYKGYDITYDTLLRIATYKNIKDAFQEGKSKGLIHQFDYSNLYSSGHTNKGAFIVKFQNYEIIRVE